MFKCIFCGYDAPSETARFCGECGPDGPAKDWTQEGIDQPAKVSQYVSILSEFYFDAQTGAEVERFSLRMRERLKISHDTHSSVLSKLATQKKAIAHLANFRIEFNENVTDAYAGHDTYLSFRYTNLSEEDLFKISLLWDDPETTDRVDFRAQTSSFVKPQGIATLGGSVIFDRMGIKELADMQITIEDQFGESANFKAEPFSFRVGNHDQRITQNISTHNQISIEGRGVVDASGMGTEKVALHPATNNQAKWKNLVFSYRPDIKALLDELAYDMLVRQNVVEADRLAKEAQQKREELEEKVKLSLEVKKEDTRKLTAELDKALTIATTDGFKADKIKSQSTEITTAIEIGKVYKGRITKILDFGAVVNLLPGLDGLLHVSQIAHGRVENVTEYLSKGQIVKVKVKETDEKGRIKLSMQALLSGKEVEVTKSKKSPTVPFDKTAVKSVLKAALQGNADAQNTLGGIYAEGQKVTQSDEQAIVWFKKAAAQGHEDAIRSLKTLESAQASAPPPSNGHGWWDYGTHIYNGMFKDGQWNGLGEVIWTGQKVGHKYEGSFVNGKRHGNGKYTFPNGETEVGWFENNVFIRPEKPKANIAPTKWLTTKPVAPAKSKATSAPASPPSNGHGWWDYGTHIYNGMFKDGQWNGLGEVIWTGQKVGHKYEGSFVNGKRHGNGKYTFPNGETQVGLFENNEFINSKESNGQTGANNKKENNSNINNSFTKDIIIYYATKKIGSLGQNFYINNGDKFTKKINSFSISFSEVHYKKFNPVTDTPLLFYDGTILGSGKDGIAFTDKCIFAKGCLGRSVKHIDILYSQIKNVRASGNNVRSKEIYIESSGHAELIVLNPIYIEIDDVLLIVQMLNEIIRRP
jgi:predicted RNA-binding protein with RPS1 domain